MKILSRWLATLAILALALVLLSTVVYAQPPMPHSFYGTVKINGQDAPIDTVVTAKFGAGVTCGTYTTTEAGKYGDPATASYLFVTHDNLHEGDSISFYVNGVDTGETASFIPGGELEGPTELNLTLGPTLPGDANGDGQLDALDITKVEREIAQLDPLTPGADANEDGSVDAMDITKVERLIAGLD